MQLPLGNGGNGNMTNVGHTRQRFASKSHRLYRQQILKRRQLRSRVPLAQYRQILVLKQQNQVHNRRGGKKPKKGEIFSFHFPEN